MKISFIAFTSILAGSAGFAADAPTKPPDFFVKSLEELMEVSIFSVSKRPEPLAEAAAAVTVISNEDIRRFGATTLPEALRLAPGLHVARQDSHTWAISSRGFTDQFANKLLVLMDGRSIYTPLFSGVFWEAHAPMLEDLDRIEVINGPGASLWGANAVNGVINIISKSASETQGLLISSGGGTEERGFGALRYGGKLSETAHYRVYASFANRDDFVLPSGADAADEWNIGQGGFRIDWKPTEQNNLTLQGDIYGGRLHQRYTLATPTPPFVMTALDKTRIRGGNVLGRWTHTFAEASTLQVQTYYDRTERRALTVWEDRDTFDLEAQHRFALFECNDIIWGAGYRWLHDDIGNTYTLTFTPAEKSTHLFSTFIQDRISLIKERLQLTLGSRFEHNDYSGFEIQPDARLLWTPHTSHAVWFSASRAVRTPSRAESDVRLNQPGPLPGTVVSLNGSPEFDSEELISYQLGYRVQPAKGLSVSLATFYNEYDNLRTLEPGPITPAIPLLIPFFASNKMDGETYGFEISPQVQITDWWRCQGSYSLLEMQLHLDRNSRSALGESEEGRTPRHQFGLRSLMDLPGGWQVDAGVRYADDLPSLGVPAYLVLDTRIGWRPRENLEISLVAQNLLDKQHPEFRPSFIRSEGAEVEHSVYAKATLRF